MPAIDHPLGVAASLPGQLAALRKSVKDLSVNKTQSPASLVIGAGGLTVAGATTLTGGVAGPVAATGAISGTTITGTSLAVGSGTITGGAVNGATVTTTGAAGIGAGLTVGASVNVTGDVFIPNRTAVVSGYFGLWVNSDGRIGISSSAERYKQDITAHTYTLAEIETLAVVTYRLKTAVALLGDGARVEVGVIAEQLIAAGFSEFVQFNADGTTETVSYDRLALVGLAGVQLLSARVKSIEARLTAGGL